MTPTRADLLPPAVAEAIASLFPGDEWSEVREAVTRAACDRVSPLRIGFDSSLFRGIKPRLKAVAEAMAAAGLFDAPRFYLLREIEQFRRDQYRLARSCRAAGLGDESPAAPELPHAITVRALGQQAYPSLKLQVHAAMRRHGWRLDGRGCWIEPRKLLASEKGGAA